MPKSLPASRPTRKIPKTKTSKPVISRMSPWFRLYTSIRQDPKVLVLNRGDRWNYVALLTMAGEAKDGTLPRNRAHIAIELRLDLLETEQLLNNFIETGLLDVVGWEGDVAVLSPHNWSGRQYKSDHDVADRVREHRARKKPTDDVPTVQDVTLQKRNSNVSALYSASVSVSEREEQDHRPRGFPGRDVGSFSGYVSDADGGEDEA